MSTHLEALRQFRQAIYRSFPYRRDSLLDLLDALSSNDRARSTVELSLNPCFRRQYSALYKAISQADIESDYPVCSREAYQQGTVLLSTLLPPRSRFLILCLAWMRRPTNGGMPAVLRTARTFIGLRPWRSNDRSVKAINYLVLVAFPETTVDDWSRWALPISVEQVSILSHAIEVAHHQIEQLMSYPQSPLPSLKVLTVDSRYPTPAFLYDVSSTLENRWRQGF